MYLSTGQGDDEKADGFCVETGTRSTKMPPHREAAIRAGAVALPFMSLIGRIFFDLLVYS